MPRIRRAIAVIVVVVLGMSVPDKTGRASPPTPDKADSSNSAPPLYAFCVEEGVPEEKTGLVRYW